MDLFENFCGPENCGFWGTVYDYQTLIAGILACLAGAAVIYGTKMQIDAQFSNERGQRAHIAANIKLQIHAHLLRLLGAIETIGTRRRLEEMIWEDDKTPPLFQSEVIAAAKAAFSHCWTEAMKLDVTSAGELFVLLTQAETCLALFGEVLDIASNTKYPQRVPHEVEDARERLVKAINAVTTSAGLPPHDFTRKVKG